MRAWPSSFGRALSRVSARPRAERRLLVEAVVALAVARVGVVVLPFRRILDLLDLRAGPGTGEPDATQIDEAAAVGRVVRAAAAALPWHSSCLMQAVAARALLSRRGLPAVLYLGVARDPHSKAGVTAHAWLCCGRSVVVGRAGQAGFATLATYG